ncbi:Ribose-phosphate diphosphokinase [Bertholletia excelsa]
MSAAPPPLPPATSRKRSKTLAPSPLHSFLSPKPSEVRSLPKCRIRCELTSFESPRKWTVDCVSGSDPIHIILKPPPMSFSMSSNETHDTAVKSGKKVLLFYCAEMKALAERIAAGSDAIELRSITWKTFEDGFPNLFIPNAHGIRGQHVAFLASFSSPGMIFEQLSVIYALPKLFVSSFTLVLPFFPTGTSERMEEEGDVATAFTLARTLSNIPISRGGPTSLVIFDIHALQERFYFGDNILPCFESGIPLLKSRLQQLPDSDNISIAFPDDGSWKRFHKQLQHFPMIVCNKVREGDQRIVRLKEGDPKGRHVVIVDDLVQSGGTLIECQKLLAKHGAAKISAYVTHGIFPNKSWARFKHDNGGRPEDGLAYFWITDSCPLTVKEVKNRAPFEVLSLAGSIAAALQI